jgi:hypothetical protein
MATLTPTTTSTYSKVVPTADPSYKVVVEEDGKQSLVPTTTVSKTVLPTKTTSVTVADPKTTYVAPSLVKYTAPTDTKTSTVTPTTKPAFAVVTEADGKQSLVPVTTVGSKTSLLPTTKTSTTPTVIGTATDAAIYGASPLVKPAPTVVTTSKEPVKYVEPTKTSTLTPTTTKAPVESSFKVVEEPDGKRSIVPTTSTANIEASSKVPLTPTTSTQAGAPAKETLFTPSEPSPLVVQTSPLVRTRTIVTTIRESSGGDGAPPKPLEPTSTTPAWDVPPLLVVPGGETGPLPSPGGQTQSTEEPGLFDKFSASVAAHPVAWALGAAAVGYLLLAREKGVAE